jgi:membrane protein DedA with SNARE-associated domain
MIWRKVLYTQFFVRAQLAPRYNKCTSLLMNPFHSFFFAYLPHSPLIAYILIFLGMVVEGEVTLFTALYLAQIGYLSFEYVGPVLIGGIFVGDFLWYRLGIFLHKHPRFARIRAFVERMTRLLDEQIVARPIHTLFVSKFTYGINRAAIVRAGALGIPLTTFLEADIMAVLAWLGVIGGIAYKLSLSLTHASRYIRYVEIGFIIGVLAFIIITHLVSKLSYANVKKTEQKVREKKQKS